MFNFILPLFRNLSSVFGCFVQILLTQIFAASPAFSYKCRRICTISHAPSNAPDVRDKAHRLPTSVSDSRVTLCSLM